MVLMYSILLDIMESKLSKSDLARVERNRQRALLLRSSLLAKKAESEQSTMLLGGNGRTVDSGGGFFIELDEATDRQMSNLPSNAFGNEEDIDFTVANRCESCAITFNNSFFFKNFDVLVCDGCRSKDTKSFKLITKTDAKSTYLLKDYDFENRDVKLRFISKKNPHNSFSGDMKLYYQPQVVELARKVWGTLAKLEDEKQIRKAKSEKMRHKKLEKRVKELRRAVRTSTWHRDLKTHEHQFGEETYDEAADIYTKTCSDCGHIVEFEKM